MIIRAAHNSTYPKVAVQWLNQALCSEQTFVLKSPPIANLQTVKGKLEPKLTNG
jgi:hypothetical protein